MSGKFFFACLFLTKASFLSLMISFPNSLSYIILQSGKGTNTLATCFIHKCAKAGPISQRKVWIAATSASDDGKDPMFEEVSDEDMAFIIDVVLGEEHTTALNKKVEDAMLEDWDIAQGVNTNVRTKPVPLKANIDLWSFAARQEMLKGNFSGAEALYRRCISYNPCDGRAWLGIARILYKKGQPELAEKAYKDGLYYNADNPFLLQAWAVQSEKMGKIKQALALLTNSIKKNPKHAASWVAMGKIKQRQGDVSSARYCYSSAVDADGKSYVALQAWASLEAQAGDFGDDADGNGVNVKKAKELLERAIRIAPRSGHSLQLLATLERKDGRLDSAERYLQQALAVYPTNTRVRLGLAEVFELRGEVAQARETFRKGEASASNCGDAGFFQSWALFELRHHMDMDTDKANGAESKGEKDDESERRTTDSETEPGTTGKGAMGAEAAMRTARQTMREEVFLEELPDYELFYDEEEEDEDGGRILVDRDAGDMRVGSRRRSGSISSSGGSLGSEASDKSFESKKEERIEDVRSGTAAQMRQRERERRAGRDEERDISDEMKLLVRRLFKKAITVNKYHSASWVAWAKFEQKSGSPDVAKKLLIAGISNFPHSKNIGWFHCALGHLSRQEGDINTSRACYARALEATPVFKSLPVMLEYIRMETYHGSSEEAKRLLELGIRRFPDENRVWDAYEELLKRQAAAGPLRSNLPRNRRYNPLILIGRNGEDGSKNVGVRSGSNIVSTSDSNRNSAPTSPSNSAEYSDIDSLAAAIAGLRKRRQATLLRETEIL